MSISTYVPDSAKILHTAYADFVSRQIGRPVHIVQYDDSMPILAVKLFQDGLEYQLPQNANVNIRFKKPDGTNVYNPALGCSGDRKIVYFEVTPQMAAYPGESSPVVELEKGGLVASTSPIGITIERNPVPNDEITSTNEYKSMVRYVNEAIEAAASASASRSAAEISESNAKKSEDSANVSKTNAKEYADSANTSKNASAVSEDHAEAAAVRAEAAAEAALAVVDEAVSVKYSYAVCNTAMGTQEKTISISGFVLAAGAKVTVKFSNGNSAASPTLNVSGKGAKDIYYNGAPVSKNFIKRESVHEFVYDGAHWLLEGEKGAGYYHVSCGTRAVEREKIVPLAGFRLVNGVLLVLQFKYGNRVENPTLNVENTGAYPIYYMGEPVPPGYITANSAVPLVFDGQNRWVIVGDFIQQQLDDLKRFVHYEEILWGEMMQITQYQNYVFDYYFDHGSVYPAYMRQLRDTGYAKCTSVPIIDAHDPNEVYKIMTHNLNLAPGDTLSHSSPIGIGYDRDTTGGQYDFSMIADTDYDIMTQDVIKNENGIYIVTPYKLRDSSKGTGMLIFINSWGSASDIAVYRGTRKIW